MRTYTKRLEKAYDKLEKAMEKVKCQLDSYIPLTSFRLYSKEQELEEPEIKAHGYNYRNFHLIFYKWGRDGEKHDVYTINGITDAVISVDKRGSR